MIGGKPMIVPVIAFDVTYHWDGEGEAFGQNAGSFVIGREQGASGSEKPAPLPLDRASYTVDRPGARATAIKRRQSSGPKGQRLFVAGQHRLRQDGHDRQRGV